MDLMEVPSHVTEHFARSEASVRGFMRHHISGRPMPPPLLQQLRASQRLFEATNLQQQACASQSFFFPRLLSYPTTTPISCAEEEEVSQLQSGQGTQEPNEAAARGFGVKCQLP